MAEPTLAEVYGADTTQSGGTLNVAKTAMSARGLTPAVDNTAESMLVAIILTAAQSLTEANRLLDLVNRNIAIIYTGQDLIDQGGGNVFLRDTYQISFYKSQAILSIDPDNY